MIQETISNLGVVFVGGLLATAHCLGMCGGLIGAYSMAEAGRLGERPTSWERLRPHLLYGLGRVGTYVALGAITGAAGSLLAMTSRMAGVAGLTHILFGLAMILFGLGSIGWSPMAVEQRLGEKMALASGPINRGLGRILGGSGGPLPLGLLTGLLPCAMHWAFQAKAAESGSILGGMAVMAAFGLGTLVPLTLFGLAATTLSQKARATILKAAGALVIFMGLRAIKRGLELAGLF